MLELFYDFKTFHFDKETKNWETKFNPNDYKRPIKLRFDLINGKDNKKLSTNIKSSRYLYLV